ncbi:beta-galactosidase [Sphingopyxis sp. DHUNG17]|uniref:alpha-amylase family protein n=1 Tax=Sphingopyxis jiangsuensis TaxID=2871171 RepID=UPI00191F802B|nr:beta-galactosidase [Sphingopyxis lutea]
MPAGLEQSAVAKIAALEAHMGAAKAAGHDITREETTVWFAREFLKFANWDEANPKAVEYAFSKFGPYADKAERWAREIPDFQRREVNEMLDRAIAELARVTSGEVARRPVNKVDWQNVVVGDNAYYSNGRPIFLYDYFSKSVGRPLTDEAVYNDHLGAIYHGGQRLYDVDHDRAINSFLLKEDGSWDEERLGYITEIPDTNVGFLIYWNMGIPEWVERREPEVRKGRSLFTGFDIDNPLVRDVWGKIARKTGAMTRGKKVTQLGYILSNEPHWFSEKGHWTQNFREMTAISSYTRTKFRSWLDRKYAGDIARLNANWGTAFKDFASVEIAIPIDPATRGTPMWYDWSRFNMDRAIDWFTHIQGELRKANPEAHTSIKIMPNMFTENARSHGIDLEALTELTSMIGDDAKAKEGRDLRLSEPQPWEEHYSYFWEELSLSYDFMESVAPDKLHFNSESHFLSTSGFRKMDMTPEYVRNAYWLATLQGMDANLGWFWARDPDGSFEDRLEGELNFFDPALAGSFVGSVNQQPQVADAVTQVMMDLNSFSEEILALREQRRPLRIFYSETSAINKSAHMSEQAKIYESLFFEGFPVGFATQKIIEKQDNGSWDAILVYRTEYVTDAEFAALQAYLDRGGTVILDRPQSLSMDEYGQRRSRRLRAKSGKLVILGEVAGLGAVKAAALDAARPGLPDVRLIEDNGTQHKGVTWRAVRQKDGSWLVNALNIGKNPAALRMETRDGKPLSATDLMTGKALGSQFPIARNGVLLMKVS